MLFDRAKLTQLKKRIELTHKVRWYSAILQKIDKTKPFAFSEFETYGNYLYSADPKRVILKKALNKSLNASIRKVSPRRLLELSKRHRSVSFHKRGSYVRKVKVKSK
ncbi:hypothetical protein D3C78_1470080 [compost metagenome]